MKAEQSEDQAAPAAWNLERQEELFRSPFVAVPTVTDSAVASLGAFQVLSELTERVEVGVPLWWNSARPILYRGCTIANITVILNGAQAE